MNNPQVEAIIAHAKQHGVQVEVTKVPAGGYELKFPRTTLRERTITGAKKAVELAAAIARHENHAKLMDELGAQLVSTVCGKPVTRAQLSAAFDKVKPAGHWKNPINAVVDIASEEEMAMIQEAVSFFAGCHATFELVSGPGNCTGKYRVRAAGYFMAVGA